MPDLLPERFPQFVLLIRHHLVGGRRRWFASDFLYDVSLDVLNWRRRGLTPKTPSQSETVPTSAGHDS